MIIKQNIVLPGSRNGEVFVVANYSPLRNSSKNYVLLAVWGIMILVLSAYLIGRLLVSRSMKYIELTYEKQKQFVSNAAHELRTPLSVLLSYAELLEYKPGDKKLLAALKEEIAQMNGLIDHLLALARFENQMIPLQRQSIDLKELVTETAAALSSLCPACPITVELPAEELSVMADRRMLRQLLNILLDNALKYTSAQKRIKVFLAKENRRVRITVADNGIGIKAQDLPHLFEKFWRADLSRNDKGLGLGLCLAEMIVTLHKGKIEVKSTPGQGSEFSVVLPAEDKGLKNDTECRD